MKKNIKHIFTLVMVMSMLLSCVAVASATEVSPAVDATPVVVNITDDMGIEPHSTYAITEADYGTEVAKRGSFTINESTLVTLIVNCKVSGSCIIYRNANQVCGASFNAPGGRYTVSRIKLTPGTYDYVITFNNNTELWGYQFLATEYYYG